MGLEDGSCHHRHHSLWALCSGDAVTTARKGDQPQLRAEGAEWGQTLAPATQQGLQRAFRERAWPVLHLTSRDSGPAKPGQLPGSYGSSSLTGSRGPFLWDQKFT